MTSVFGKKKLLRENTSQSKQNIYARMEYDSLDLWTKSITRRLQGFFPWKSVTKLAHQLHKFSLGSHLVGFGSILLMDKWRGRLWLSRYPAQNKLVVPGQLAWDHYHLLTATNLSA